MLVIRVDLVVKDGHIEITIHKSKNHLLVERDIITVDEIIEIICDNIPTLDINVLDILLGHQTHLDQLFPPLLEQFHINLLESQHIHTQMQAKVSNDPAGVKFCFIS